MSMRIPTNARVICDDTDPTREMVGEEAAERLKEAIIADGAESLRYSQFEDNACVELCAFADPETDERRYAVLAVAFGITEDDVVIDFGSLAKARRWYVRTANAMAEHHYLESTDITDNDFQALAVGVIDRFRTWLGMHPRALHDDVARMYLLEFDPTPPLVHSVQN